MTKFLKIVSLFVSLVFLAGLVLSCTKAEEPDKSEWAVVATPPESAKKGEIRVFEISVEQTKDEWSELYQQFQEECKNCDNAALTDLAKRGTGVWFEFPASEQILFVGAETTPKTYQSIMDRFVAQRKLEKAKWQSFLSRLSDSEKSKLELSCSCSRMINGAYRNVLAMGRPVDFDFVDWVFDTAAVFDPPKIGGYFAKIQAEVNNKSVECFVLFDLEEVVKNNMINSLCPDKTFLSYLQDEYWDPCATGGTVIAQPPEKIESGTAFLYQFSIDIPDADLQTLYQEFCAECQTCDPDALQDVAREGTCAWFQVTTKDSGYFVFVDQNLAPKTFQAFTDLWMKNQEQEQARWQAFFEGLTDTEKDALNIDCDVYLLQNYQAKLHISLGVKPDFVSNLFKTEIIAPPQEGNYLAYVKAKANEKSIELALLCDYERAIQSTDS